MFKGNEPDPSQHATFLQHRCARHHCKRAEPVRVQLGNFPAAHFTQVQSPKARHPLLSACRLLQCVSILNAHEFPFQAFVAHMPFNSFYLFDTSLNSAVQSSHLPHTFQFHRRFNFPPCLRVLFHKPLSPTIDSPDLTPQQQPCRSFPDYCLTSFTSDAFRNTNTGLVQCSDPILFGGGVAPRTKNSVC